MKNYNILTVTSVVVTLTLGGSLALAKTEQTVEDKGNSEHAEHMNHQAQDKKPKSDHSFSHDEHELIQDYYYRHRYDSGRTVIPKGLQKKRQRTGELPPGWQMKVQRGQVLPIDIYQHAGSIPIELREQLPTGPTGSKIIELEGKIIRVMEDTRMILDVFDIGR